MNRFLKNIKYTSIGIFVLLFQFWGTQLEAIPTLDETAMIVIDLSVDMPGGCIPGSTATVTATASGGTPGYTYAWSNGASGQVVSGLPAGSYWVTVTDAIGDTQSRNFAVARGGLQVDVTVDPGVCGANSGTATAVVTGGTPPFSYNLQPGNIRSQTVTGLAPGTYTFYVRDVAGCKGEQTFEIPGSGLIVTTTANDISCGGTNDGSVQATVSGGTPGYTYVWTNNGFVVGNAPNVNNLAAGTYTVAVTDNAGCSGSATVTVNDRPAIMLSVSSTLSDCGASNGTATVTATGGTPPFSYLWCDGQTTQTAIGLPGSVCGVEVTDAAGCKERTTVTIGENSDLAAQIDNETDADCGASNGSATASGTGGTLPYSFLWCNGQTTPTAMNLPAGSCTVTITDANQCRATATANIGQNNLDVSIVPDPGNCDMPPTAATAIVTGGTSPYNYSWNDGQNTQRADNLTPGSPISVTVTDANGCAGSDMIILPDSILTINPDFDWEFLECFENDSMRVQFNDLTGALGANCAWDFGNGQTATGSNPIVVLSTTPAMVTLTKTAGNCSGSTTKTVDIPYLDVSISGPGNGCIGDDLSASAVNNSGAVITNYDWYPNDLILSGDGTADVTVSSDSAGTFTICVIVMSNLGCLDTICTDYTVDPKRVISPDVITYAQCDSFQVSFGGVSDVTWYFGDPTTLADSSILDNPTYLYPDTGTYKVIIVPNDPCIDTICKTIQVLPLNVDFTCDLVECVDTCLLSLIDISTLPAPIKSWKWTIVDSVSGSMQMDTVQNPDFSFTESGTYTITLEVTFGFGDSCCVKSVSKTKEITCFDPPTIGSCQQTVCYGDTTKLTFVGADPDLIFTFPQDSCIVIDSTGAVCFIAAKDDTTIVFPVMVTVDSCSAMTDYTIIIPPRIEFEILGDTIVCDSTPVELIATGNYTYEWSENLDFDPVFSTNDTVYVTPGRPTTYYVRATDAAGCSKIDQHTVGNYQVGIEIQGDPIICIGDSTVLTLQNDHLGDTLDIIWAPIDIIISGQGTDQVTVMPTSNTVVSVEATNQFGCMETDTFTMQVNNANEGLEITASLDTIYDHETTDLFATEGYDTYRWEPESTVDPVDEPITTASPDLSTLYQLTVTDEEGCVGNGEIFITVLSPPCGRPHVFLPNAFTPNGDNLNDVLFVRGNVVDEVHLMIFNRWGEKVFETRDQSIGWNGEWGEKGVCPDVYGYYMTVRCFNGEDYVEKGNITVLK